MDSADFYILVHIFLLLNTIIINGCVSLLVWKHGKLRSAFSILIGGRCMELTAYSTLLCFHRIYYFLLSSRPGDRILRLIDAYLFATHQTVLSVIHCAIAINRYYAITWPMEYSVFFSKKLTYRILIVTYIISSLLFVPVFIDRCSVRLDFTSRKYIADSTTCAVIMQKLPLFLLGSSCLSAAIIDLMTWCNLKKTPKVGIRRTRTYSIEVKFFVQSLVVDTFFVGIIIYLHIIQALHLHEVMRLINLFILEFAVNLVGLMFIACSPQTKSLRAKLLRYAQC